MKMAERSTSKKALQQTIILARGAKSKDGLAPHAGWFNPDYLNPVVVPTCSNDSDADRVSPIPPCPARKASSECKKLFSPRPLDGSKSKRQRQKNYKCRRSSSSWGPRTVNGNSSGNWPSLDDLIPRDPHRISDTEANVTVGGTSSKKQLKSKKKDLAASSPSTPPRKQNDLITTNDNKPPPSRASPGKSSSSNHVDGRQRLSPPITSTKSVTPPSTRTSPVADCSSLFPSLKSSPTGGDRRKSSGPSIRLLSTKLSHTNLPTCSNQTVKIAQKFSDTKLLNFSDPSKLARQLTAVIPKENMAGQNGGDMKLESPEINPFKPTPFFEAIESPVVLENLEIKKFNISTPFFERKSSMESVDNAKKLLVVPDSAQLVDKSAGDQPDFQVSTVPTTSKNKIATEPTAFTKMATEPTTTLSTKIATEPTTLSPKMPTEQTTTVSTKMATEPKPLKAKITIEPTTNPARQSPRKLHGKSPRVTQDATLKSPGRSKCQALSKFSSEKKSALDLIPPLSGRASKAETGDQKPASQSVSSTTIILSSTTILNTTLVVQQSQATTCDSCGKAVQVTNIQSMPPSPRKSATSTSIVENFQEIPSEIPEEVLSKIPEEILPKIPEEMLSKMSKETSSSFSEQVHSFAIESAPTSQSNTTDKTSKFEQSKSTVLVQDHKDAPVTEDANEEDAVAKNKLVWVPTSFFNRINKNASASIEPISSSSETQPDLISGGAISKCKSEESQSSSVGSNSTFIVQKGLENVSVGDGPTTSSSDTAIQLGETQYFLPLITHDEQKFFGCIRPVRRSDSRRQISPPQFVKANKSTAWKSIRCQGGSTTVSNTRITCAGTAMLTSSTRSSTTRRKGPRILKLLSPAISSTAQSPIAGSTRRKGWNSGQSGILLLPAGSEFGQESSPSKCSDDNDNNNEDLASKFELDPIFAFRIPSFELIPLQRIIENNNSDELRSDSSVEEPNDSARCEGCNIIDLITPSASTDQEIMRETWTTDEVDLSEYKKPGGFPSFVHNVVEYYYDDEHDLLTQQVSTQPEQSSSNKFTIIQASASNSTNNASIIASPSSSSAARSYYNSQARLSYRSRRRTGWKQSRFSRFCRWSHVRTVTLSRHFQALFPSCCSSSSSTSASNKPSESNESSGSSIIQLY